MRDDKPMERRPDKLIGRRAALAKLGLSALVVYAAPSIVHLDRSANAQVRPSCHGKSKGNPWCNKGKGKGKGGKGKGKRNRNPRNNRNNRNNRVNRNNRR
jgi:hypothetical protein